MRYVRDWTKVRNHITVQGREGIKAICKDDASIQERGMRRFELYDDTITAQEAAETKAASLLAQMVAPREYTAE